MLNVDMLRLSPELWQNKVFFNFTWQGLMIVLFFDSSFEHYQKCNPDYNLILPQDQALWIRIAEARTEKATDRVLAMWCPRFPLSILTIAR